nr:hypothetical protein [Escherichia coli]
MFYQFVDFKAKVFSYIDRVCSEAGSLAGPQIPYRYRFPDEWWCKSPKPGQEQNVVCLVKPITASSAAKYRTGWWARQEAVPLAATRKVIPI